MKFGFGSSCNFIRRHCLLKDSLLRYWLLALVGVFLLPLDFVQALSSTVKAVNYGQVLMVGFNEATITPDLLAHLKKIRPGAIILFRRNIQNPKQLRLLISTLQRELNPILDSPLLFAIDQEGGNVFRIPSNPRIPSPAAVGKSRDPKIVERYGFAIGKFLRKNGISMNLAPVLDLENQEMTNFIGNRSFGSEPLHVAEMGYLFSKGLAEAGVVPTGKHFPGLGSVITDPHQVTPISDFEWKQDWNRELLPFRQFCQLTPSALMLSHVVYPKLDSQRLPASISPYIIQTILRETLKYDGLVITDDLLMKGISDKMKPSEAALASLRSGADLVMLSWSRKDQLDVYDAIKNSIESGDFSKVAFDRKMERIRKIKSLIGLTNRIEVGPEDWESHEIRTLNKELLVRNLSLDQENYRKVDPQDSIYVYNLNNVWAWHLSKRFGGQKVVPIERPQQYLKMSDLQKTKGLLFLGLQRRDQLKILQSMTLKDQGRVVLILMNDLKVENPLNYYSVFKPLWPFEDLAGTILQYL